mmetsp:Transcript_36080/g.91172  ORF Transcript_36080/g.91172 Transcript_36080/m.91172 type:complete len:386 (+) Transcript_36080:1991-3148(+)
MRVRQHHHGLAPHLAAQRLVDEPQQRQLAQRGAASVQAVHPEHVVGLVPPVGRADALEQGAVLRLLGRGRVQAGRVDQLQLHAVHHAAHHAHALGGLAKRRRLGRGALQQRVDQLRLARAAHAQQQHLDLEPQLGVGRLARVQLARRLLRRARQVHLARRVLVHARARHGLHALDDAHELLHLLAVVAQAQAARRAHQLHAQLLDARLDLLVLLVLRGVHDLRGGLRGWRRARHGGRRRCGAHGRRRGCGGGCGAGQPASTAQARRARGQGRPCACTCCGPAHAWPWGQAGAGRSAGCCWLRGRRWGGCCWRRGGGSGSRRCAAARRTQACTRRQAWQAGRLSWQSWQALGGCRRSRRGRCCRCGRGWLRGRSRLWLPTRRQGSA